MNSATIYGLLKRFVVLVVSRLAGALAIFAVNLLIARHAGLETLGSYAIFASLVSILTICLPVGFNSIATIFSTEYSTTQNTGMLKGFVQTALFYIAVATGSLLFVSIIAFYLVPDLLNSMDLGFCLGVIVAGCACALLNLNSAVKTGLNQQLSGLLPETLARPLLMLSGILIVFEFGSATGIFEIIWTAALSSWLALVVVLIINSRFAKNIIATPALFDLKRWKSASYPWMATSLLWDYMIDLILLLSSVLLGAAEIAILHICFRYRVLTGFGMRSIYTLLMPKITAHKFSGETDQMHRKLIFANAGAFIYSVCVMVGFLIFGEWLLSLFSSRISEGLPVLIIVSLTMVIRSVFGPAPIILAIHNLHYGTTIISFGGILIAITTIFVFHQNYGLIAVAAGYSLSNLFVSVSLWLYAMNRTGIDCSLFSVFKMHVNKTKLQ